MPELTAPLPLTLPAARITPPPAEGRPVPRPQIVSDRAHAMVAARQSRMQVRSGEQGLDVLLALPQDDYRRSLASYLRRQGFGVVETGNAQATIAQALTGEKIHVIVTADDLPDLPGLEVLTRLRDLGVNSRVALLAGAYSEIREEIALECGAAEFLCRSRRHSIIAKRLNLLVAGSKRHLRHDPAPSENFRLGRLVLKSDCHRALWRGREVHLTVTEVRIVRLLACRAGAALSYREIYDMVHGAGFRAGEGAEGFRTNVRSLIRKIRKRFRALDPNFDEIENCPGYGYRWRDKRAT